MKRFLQDIQSPGACHRARWMAKAIYCIKIYLYRKQLKWLRPHLLKQLKRMIKFIVKLYLKAWYTCRSAILAPFDDLTLLQDLMNYETTDKEIANAAYDSLSRHLWYLRQPLVGLPFFYERINVAEKRKMIEALKRETSDDYENKITIDKKTVQAVRMHELVSKNILKFLADFGVNLEFLKQDPDTWNEDDNFHSASNYFKKLQVVNDSAERNLRLTDTLNKSFKNEDEFNELLHVVKNHRKKYPNAKKCTLLQKIEKSGKSSKKVN